MKNKYKIGVLSSAILVALPLSAEDLPSACTPPNMDPWSCYWLEGKITENMCGGALAPDIDRIQAEAEEGNFAAAFRLGQLYAAGTWGVTRDYEKAYEWLTRSAEGGNRDGQIELAKLYEFGRGIEQDRAKALHWYKQAIKNGPYKGINRKVDYLEKQLNR